jgi:hypothetical protein
MEQLTSNGDEKAIKLKLYMRIIDWFGAEIGSIDLLIVHR